MNIKVPVTLLLWSIIHLIAQTVIVIVSMLIFGEGNPYILAGLVLMLPVAYFIGYKATKNLLSKGAGKYGSPFTIGLYVGLTASLLSAIIDYLFLSGEFSIAKGILPVIISGFGGKLASKK